MDNKPNFNGKRIFGISHELSNDSWETQLNANDLIIGVSGSGKTTGYVIPNVRRCQGSYVVTDTKGNLARKLTPTMEKNGYKCITLDFVDLRRSCKYNPLDFIRRDENGRYNEQDVYSIANTLCPVTTLHEPFWEKSAQTFIASMIAYVLEALPPEEQDLVSVADVFCHFGQIESDKLFAQHKEKCPDGLALKLYNKIKRTKSADKTYNSIMQFVTDALKLFDFHESRRVFSGRSEFDFASIGREKTILFVNVSDTDRSLDRFANVFYSQLFKELCRCADENENNALDIPTRIILDDFANNCYIPDFDKIMSVIRSRNISASVILQSLSQLRASYSEAQALTLINSFDTWLYLGGFDLESAEAIGNLANCPRETVLGMPLGKAYVFHRGSLATLIDKLPPNYIDTENSKPDAERDCLS